MSFLVLSLLRCEEPLVIVRTAVAVDCGESGIDRADRFLLIVNQSRTLIAEFSIDSGAVRAARVYYVPFAEACVYSQHSPLPTVHVRFVRTRTSRSGSRTRLHIAFPKSLARTRGR
jgi:hypothetical protein